MEGTSPVFNPIGCNQNVYLQFFLSSPTDLGKGITVYGIDSNGQVVMSQRQDGTIQEGVRLILAKPFVQTPVKFRPVTRINKDETNYRKLFRITFAPASDRTVVSALPADRWVAVRWRLRPW